MVVQDQKNSAPPKPDGGKTGTSNREAIRAWHQLEEAQALDRLLPLTHLEPSALQQVSRHAETLIALIRQDNAETTRLNQLLQDYDLSNEEGVALMCLAESLLRVPDNNTADRLIADKLSAGNWRSHLDENQPFLINAAAWALALGKSMTAQTEARGNISDLLGRLGAPVLRTALRAAMSAIGELYVFAENIDEAVRRARGQARPYEHFSFDMLGEAACTEAQAEAFFVQYQSAIRGLAAGSDTLTQPAVSVKLSALHPLYRPEKHEQVVNELYPKLLELCLQAAQNGIDVCVDAEETDRLELSLDLIERLLEEKSLHDWGGLGLAVQAYQKRAYPVLAWLAEQCRRADSVLRVRLVKGAYWDSEIKWAQTLGLGDFPVYTRKVNTDVSYLACAHFLLNQSRLQPQFATHNAVTIATLLEMNRSNKTPIELQRLHGMGEALHRKINESHRIATRIYAPVGIRERLLPYLVRRLLENGANSSFVNQIARDDVDIGTLASHPTAIFQSLTTVANPRIAKPADLYAPERVNAAGIDFSNREEVSALYESMNSATIPVQARPLVCDGPGHDTGDRNTTTAARQRQANRRPVINPSNQRNPLGEVIDTTVEQARQALESADKFTPTWSAWNANDRAQYLIQAADLLQQEKPGLMTLCIREAGKTVQDAEVEVREAIDFCRYYAAQMRHLAQPVALPGPVGEDNRLLWEARGPFLCISPWNFPLAIFTGQAMAAVVSGNPVLLKPAEHTSLIAAAAVDIFHRAGIPVPALQLLPGSGAALGAALLGEHRLKGVAFTGSVTTAANIQRRLAARDDGIIPLIAETGGQNAMLVDSTALPEQVVRDVIKSAFVSAGQRCSCLRLLYLQEDVADDLIELIRGAMRLLRLGDPWQLATDVGPVISAQSAQALRSHIDSLSRDARDMYATPLPDDLPEGHFVAPTLLELHDSRQLEGEVFGPVLHVVRYATEDIDAVISAINATGFGLTLGIHSRIASFCDYVSHAVKVGNVYVNRHMTGAVVGSQPFGGRNLSGTGFKAGGPNYLKRFMTEKCMSVDTTAAGGNASLLGDSHSQ